MQMNVTKHILNINRAALSENILRTGQIKRNLNTLSWQHNRLYLEKNESKAEGQYQIRDTLTRLAFVAMF